VTGQPVAGTYQTLTLPATDPVAIKLCTTQAAANKFQPCASDTNCGGTPTACQQTPWVDAGGITQPTPVGAKTIFTVADGGTSCANPACIACGNPNAACAGIPGCADPASGCFRSWCCDNPHFILPPILIAPGVLNICTRVDQADCGTGEINTSNPQTGDNEVKKSGDTSDPGPDCKYGTADDPPAKACTVTGEGADTAGLITRHIGNAAADTPNGMHIRLQTPSLTTAWTNDDEGCAAPPCTGGKCNNGAGTKTCSTDADCNAKFGSACVSGMCNNGAGPACTTNADCNEALSSQLLLFEEPTTAGATAQFSNAVADGGNGDTSNCASAGNNFEGTPTSRGPYTISGAAIAPAPYGGGAGTGYRSAAAGPVFSGGTLHDIGFIAITPTGSPTVVPPESCTCTPAPPLRRCLNAPGTTCITDMSCPSMLVGSCPTATSCAEVTP